MAEEDRHYTTFITEWGRFRYLVAPQGFCASGDAYNQRYARVLEEMDRYTRCVDDLAMWDETIEEHWWRVLKYMDLVGRNGIVLNPEKFQFCSRIIEFAGFVITDTEVKPPEKYLRAIESFPRPTNISGMRSWFGLVNQVSNYARLGDIMAPFKPFLSPRMRFEWNEQLEDAFNKSKVEIVEAIKLGVTIFDPTRTTVLSPDWSKTGMGYFMYQKVCQCPSTVTTCCANGWRVVLAGSRFLRGAEANYCPLEGEALAVAWALHDTKFFTLGCTDLHIQTDHRPLVSLLGDKALDEITNRRLVNLKEKTFPWQFKISWVPGRLIPAPDATSRHPQVDDGSEDNLELALAAIAVDKGQDEVDLAGEKELAEMAEFSMEKFRAVTMERVREETGSDRAMADLVLQIESGFHDSLDRLSVEVAKFWRHRADLNVVDGVVMLGNRVVIPRRLRREVIQHLHAAHQGVSAMTARATAAVYWPGILSDIQAVRDGCLTCEKNAPSQRQMHPVPPMVPKVPFEAVCTDYFDLGGAHYIVYVDRFTNWAEVRRAKPGTTESGAAGLITLCRELFMTFGVPAELSSDGGPEYASHAFDNFLKKWGVHHRMSSAYLPSSNGRAEVAVKAVKRLLRDNAKENGNLDNDAVVRALLQMRNTPDRDDGRSPAQMLFGKELRDALPWKREVRPSERSETEGHPFPIDQHWHEAWDEREKALRYRFAKNVDKAEETAHDLEPLEVGDRVRLQDQRGPAKTKWSKTGVIMERNLDHQAYLVRVDGSRRATQRNRKFLKKIKLPGGVGPDPAAIFEDITRPDKVRGIIRAPEVERQEPEPAQRRAEGPTFSWEEPVQGSRAGGEATPGAAGSPPAYRPETGQRLPTWSPETPAFRTPPSTRRGGNVNSQAREGVVHTPMPSPYGASLPGAETPTRGRGMAERRRVTFADQGETVPESPPQVWSTPPAAPAGTTPLQEVAGRPQRARRRPGYLDDYETEMSCVRCRVGKTDWDGYAAYNVRGMYERDDLSWEQPLTRDSCPDACAAESDMAARTLDQRGGARAGEVLLPVVDNQAVHDVQYNHYLMPNYQYYYPMY